MAIQKLQFTLPEDEYQQVLAESQQPPYNCSVTEMVRAIVRSRHEKQVTTTGNAASLESFYKGKLTTLEAVNQDLQNRLLNAEKTGSLSGIEVKNQTQDEMKRELSRQLRAEFEQRDKDKELVTAKSECERLTKRNAELEEKNAELNASVESNEKMAGYLEMAGKGLGALIESSPVSKARFEQGGLAGLAGLGGAGNTIAIGGSLSEDQQEALKLGQMIRAEFDEESMTRLTHAIIYMRDNPSVLVSITNTDKFRQYMLGRQQRAQTAQAA